MGQYIDILHHDTLTVSIQIQVTSIYRISWYINILISIDSILHTYILYSVADALSWIDYCTLQLSALQLYNFREQKKVMSICQNLLIYIVLAIYVSLYCDIKKEYIDTCRSCIVPSLLHNYKTKIPMKWSFTNIFTYCNTIVIHSKVMHNMVLICIIPISTKRCTCVH